MKLLCDHRCIKLTVCLFQAVMVLCRKAAQGAGRQAVGSFARSASLNIQHAVQRL